jgi:RimJ/RimL family protein N-acetyltransferase
VKPPSHFPDTIRTDRLLLQPYPVSHAADLLTRVEQHRPLLTRNFAAMAQRLTSVEATIEFICDSNAQRRQGDMVQYGAYIAGHTAEQLVGQIKIKQIDWIAGSMELSYFIYPEWQRRGYASEIVSAVIGVAFANLNFKTITLRIITSNLASLRLAQQLGFTYTETRERDFVCGFGEQHDVQYWALHSHT